MKDVCPEYVFHSTVIRWFYIDAMSVTYFKTFLYIYLRASALRKVVVYKHMAEKIHVRQR